MRLVSSISFLILFVVLASACGPRTVKESVYSERGVHVQLRRTVEGGETVPLGHEQPATIADVRIAHILASLTYRVSDEETGHIVRTLHVYPLAEGIAKALEKATPDDDVIAWAVAHDRRLGIFSSPKVTAFMAHTSDGQLYFHFYEIETKLGTRSEVDGWQPPIRFPSRKPAWKLKAERAQAIGGPRTLIVDWRDDFYRRPLSLRARGGLKRRTVLMRQEEEEGELGEDPGTEPDDPSAKPTPPGMSDAQLRALDQIDGARRAGLINEAEYQRRRRLVLDGRLDEAGYAPESE